MVDLDDDYPGYGLCRHKGYCTQEHIDCLNRLGPCPIHRRSFHPIRDMLA
jgi:ribonuclease HII